MTRCLPLLFLLLASCASYAPHPAGEEIIRNLVYAHRATGDQHLDIYLPAGKPPYATLMWIHGGGWKYGSKRFQFYLRTMTERGFAVATIDYRLSGVAKYPAQYEDTKAAFDWLRANGSKYGLRTDHMFLAGASAGGHLAALLGVKEGRAKVDAVCAIYPATNLTGFDNQDGTKGYLPSLLGGSVNTHRALAESGSPVRIVTSDAPPFLFFHGDKDILVPIAQSQELDRKLRAKGVESKLVVLPGQPHNYVLNHEQINQVAKFFRQHQHR